jgi:hypothetical protein
MGWIVSWLVHGMANHKKKILNRFLGFILLTKTVYVIYNRCRTLEYLNMFWLRP